MTDLIEVLRECVGALERASKCQFQRYYTGVAPDGAKTSYLAGDDDAEYFVRQALAKAKPYLERPVVADIDLNVCPGCGGPADNGHDRCYPPNPYYCTKCDALTAIRS